MERIEPQHINCSLVMLKPETKGEIREEILNALLTHPESIMEIPGIKFTKQQAAEFWYDLAGKYHWADSYYDHMASGICHAVVLRGADTARTLKHQIRDSYSSKIASLQERLGTEFSPDLVHGSDNGNFLNELELILNCVEI